MNQTDALFWFKANDPILGDSADSTPANYSFVGDASVLVDREARFVVIHRAGQTYGWADLSSDACEVFERLTQSVAVETLRAWNLDSNRGQLITCLANHGLIARKFSEPVGEEFQRYADQLAYYCATGADPNSVLTALRKATVAIIGLGGIGSEVIRHLAAAGIGQLVCIDHDRVELSNLNRQHCYVPGDVGVLKTSALRNYLARYAPEVSVSTADYFIDAEDSLRDALSVAFGGATVTVDIIVCCADEPVGQVELACLGFARRIGAAAAFSAMHIRRGYWGVLDEPAAFERAISFFRQTACISKRIPGRKLRGSASWENSIIGGHFAGLLVSYIAGLATEQMINRLTSFDLEQLRPQVLIDFSSES